MPALDSESPSTRSYSQRLISNSARIAEAPKTDFEFWKTLFPIYTVIQWLQAHLLSQVLLLSLLLANGKWRGIYTYKDDEKLEKGKTIKLELLKAIEESRFAVVILSETYASSTWCLEELVKIIDCEKEKRMTILPIFYNVDPSDLRKLKGAFAKAFDEHEKQFKEKVDTWRAALNHVAGIVGYHVKNSPLSEVVESIVRLVSHKLSFEFSEVTEGLNFDKLRFINMAGSSNLIIASDFNGVPNLEELVLAGCSNLCKLHPSIGKLKKLKLLDLEECQELTSLPDKFEMESLVTLNLTCCSKVKKIPEFVGNMKLLQRLLLKCTAIKTLTSSIECLTDLNILILRDCKQLVCLPNTICSLTSLKNLDLFGCSKFVNLPENLGNLEGLVELSLKGTAIEVLPSSIGRLTALESLDMTDCKNLLCHPSNICSLKMLKNLYLSGCSKFVNLPENLGNLESLFLLSLKGTAIELLPSSVGRLTYLGYLDIRDCKNLLCLPSSICSLKMLKELYVSRCSKLVNLPENLENLEGLFHLSLKGTAIEVLPSSVGRLTALRQLNLKSGESRRPMSSLFKRNSNRSVAIIHWTFDYPSSIESRCSKFVNMPKNLGNLEGLVVLSLRGTAIEVLPSSIGRLTALRNLNLGDCKNLLCHPSNICSLKMLKCLHLSGSSKLVNLPENLGNLEGLFHLSLKGTVIEVMPSSVGRLTALSHLNLSNCKNLLCLPSSICSLKMLKNLYLSGCSKLVNLPENLGNLEGLFRLSLRGIAIEVLPSSVGRLTALESLDIRDCKNLVCLEDIGCLFSLRELHLCGNNFVSLPESISQLSRITWLNLDGCKRLRSLPDIPSQVHYINVNNCNSLERFPESPKNCPFWCRHFDFCVVCVNCFNIQFCVKGLISGKLVGRLPYILPGKEIPNGFEKANIRDSSVLASPSFHRCDYSVNMQLPRSGFDELRAILLCIVFVPCEHYNHSHYLIEIKSNKVWFQRIGSEYGKIESHHLALSLHYLNFFDLETPGWSIDEKRFHEVEFTIATGSVEIVRNLVKEIFFFLIFYLVIDMFA
nr:isoform 1 of protein suppressor of npr1-1, constitutive 1 [Quercus suber]